MKIILTIIFSFLVSHLIAQEDYLKIDPRRFVSIYEFSEKYSENLLWEFVCDSNCVEKKKAKYVDINSQIRIRFDHKALAEEDQFYGNISLRARVGSNDVEVSPYFLIGEKQKSYGVDSQPIKEIARNFIRLFSVSEKLDYQLGGLGVINKDQANPENVKNYLITTINEILYSYNYLRVNRNDTSLWNSYKREKLGFLLFEIQYELLSYTDIKFPNQLNLVSDEIIEFDTTSVKELNSLLDEINSNSFQSKKNNDGLVALLISRKNDYQSALNTSKELLKYMKFFKDSGANSMEAFLSISLLSDIEFEIIYENLESHIKSLEGNISKTDPKAIDDVRNIRINVTERLASYSEVIYEEWQVVRSRRDSIDLEVDSLYRQPILDLRYISPEDLISLNKVFSRNAGREIYNKLIYGTIDLSSISFSETEKIDIELVWYTNEEGLENGKILPLTSFNVKKMGWHLSIVESVQLVNRVNSDEIDDGYPISPSVFKPTPGAAFLWTYHDSMKKKNRFWKWIEPSFGINLTYLDFNTEKDFEFGIGPMVGLFQNRIHFTWGFNLNEKDVKPYYFGIGFSFSKVLTSVSNE